MPPEVCGTCPQREPCMSSNWNDSSPHPSPPGEGATLTSVHTCRTCFKRVLSSWMCKSKERRVVPDACPRWRPVAGSACDCDGCREERDALREADPRWEGLKDASVKLFQGVVAGINAKREHGENYVDLGLERERKVVVAEWVASSSPAVPILAAPESYEPAAELMQLLLGVVWDDPLFVQERETGRDDWSIEEHKIDWLYGLKLTMERHRADPEALVHEWMLLFTDRPIASRTWTRWSVPRRRLILKMWEGVTSEFLGEPDPR